MKHRLLWMAIAALLLSLPGIASAAAVPALATSAAAQTPVQVIVTVGEEAGVRIPAKLWKGQTVVPFRAFFAALGGQVSWDDSTRTATATLDGSTATITTGASQFVFNGENYLLSQPASMSAGTLYVPLRPVSLPLGASIAVSKPALTVRVHYERAEKEEQSPDERLAHWMEAVFERHEELMDGMGVMPLSGDVVNGRVAIQIRSYGDVERKLGDTELAAVRAAMYRIAGEEFPLQLDVVECCTRDPDIRGVVTKVDQDRKTIEVSGGVSRRSERIPPLSSRFLRTQSCSWTEQNQSPCSVKGRSGKI
ncbi:copper amine oxidase N-terminal domain-containing protein [Cohnella rhizosphaerae]|uniref:Copper amine oxidase N-terminal domain-containing protein n=1 Tax=Cohnella rhizosphaerae TaxID=1457232 RepID=A0A9X4KPR3_9BACL|nr:copper amine oxidase N-terminal domain-containing protein [Cohnella rhizosphaerae]MDG0808473.1 copper amine oxidase N-terminal domain-containing protein [Cohnella rhizosphaerae]